MSQKVKLNLLLDNSLWTQELADVLASKGHTVNVLNYTCGSSIGEVDAIIGYNTWRIPPMTPQSEVQKHIDTILKQIKATKHDVQTTQEGPAPKRASKKPRASAKRKQKATTEGSSAGDPTQAEGQPRTAGDNAPDTTSR